MAWLIFFNDLVEATVSRAFWKKKSIPKDLVGGDDVLTRNIVGVYFLRAISCFKSLSQTVRRENHTIYIDIVYKNAKEEKLQANNARNIKTNRKKTKRY
tara:strand:+ start:85 stop:381 length:297 start_codon:yes stop_codon:yes gene_type:complete